MTGYKMKVAYPNAWPVWGAVCLKSGLFLIFIYYVVPHIIVNVDSHINIDSHI